VRAEDEFCAVLDAKLRVLGAEQRSWLVIWQMSCGELNSLSGPEW